MKLNKNLDTLTLFNRIVDWVSTHRENKDAVLVLPLWAYQRLNEERLENIGVSGITYLKYRFDLEIHGNVETTDCSFTTFVFCK